MTVEVLPWLALWGVLGWAVGVTGLMGVTVWEQNSGGARDGIGDALARFCLGLAVGGLLLAAAAFVAALVVHGVEL